MIKPNRVFQNKKEINFKGTNREQNSRTRTKKKNVVRHENETKKENRKKRTNMQKQMNLKKCPTKGK